MKAYKAHSIAVKIACIAQEKETILSHLKLQKLLYFAQGWSYVSFKKELFSDELEAWQHGPVCASIYHDFKYRVPFEKIETNEMTEELGKKAVDFLEAVWEAYKDWSGWELEMLSHQEGPWKEYYEKGKNHVIPKEKIKSFFQKTYPKNKSS